MTEHRGAEERVGGRRWWREPLLHFVVVGAALLLADALWGGERGEPGERVEIAIPAEFVTSVQLETAERTGRPASEAELKGAVEAFVREEALYREALRLGLEKGDPIVRRRLVQKMNFLLEAPTEGEEVELGEEALEAWLEAHPERYALPARREVVQVFLSRERRGEARLEAAAREALAALEGGASFEGLGDPFMGGQRLGLLEEAELSRRVAAPFARAAMGAPVGSWVGPVASPFGLHLLRVEREEARRRPALAEVRRRVEADARAEERRQRSLRLQSALTARYEVVYEAPAVAEVAP